MRPSKPTATLVAVFTLLASIAAAGPTQTACLKSARSPGPTGCACAQALADQVLSPRDQRRAAEIIGDPDLYSIIAKRKSASAKAFIETLRTVPMTTHP